jgi:hypothetical protein
LKYHPVSQVRLSSLSFSVFLTHYLGGNLQFAALTCEIDSHCTEWFQLLLRLQQKNAGDAAGSLSESVLAVQLLQSRLSKLVGGALADCAGVQAAVAAAECRMMKVI